MPIIPAIMQADDWNDLQAFLAIAHTGQIAKAARQLGVDATTVGRRLRRLEANLNATLFEQSREGQQLTEEGERVLASVEHMNAAAQTVFRSDNRSPGPSGTLRISTSEGFGSLFLTRHVPRFSEAYPAVTLDLVASSGFLSPSKREADIAVVLSRPNSSMVETQRLADYDLMLYGSRDYLAQRGHPETIAEVASGHSLIGYIPDLLYSPELNYLGEFDRGLTPSIRSSSIVAQLHLVLAGAGLAVLPYFMAASDDRLIPILPDRRVRRHFWIVSHKDNMQLSKVTAGRNWLFDCVRSDHNLLTASI